MSLIPAVAYYRCSTEKQDTSISQQREGVEAHFADVYEIVDVYLDEGKSGSHDTAKRLDYLRMLDDLENGKYRHVKTILCLDLSRFGRLDTIDGAEHKARLRRAGVSLRTKLEGHVDWNSMQGRIIDAVLSEAQHDFSVRLASKVTPALLKAAADGRFQGGLAPYGYCREVTDNQGVKRIISRREKFTCPDSWDCRLVPGDPAEIEAVRWLFKQWVERDISYRRLAKELAEQNRPAPETTWKYPAVRDMLSNPRYAGHNFVGLHPHGKFYRTHKGNTVRVGGKMQTEATIFHDMHPSLIDEPTWMKAQAKVKARPKHRQEKKRKYALSGVLVCGRSGRSMQGTSRHPNYVRYVSPAVRVDPSSDCGYWGVSEAEILPFLSRLIVEHVDKASISNHRPQAPQDHADITATKRDIDRLDKKLANLTHQLEDLDRAASRAVIERMNELAEQKARLREELERVELSEDACLWERFEWWETNRATFVTLSTGKPAWYDEAEDEEYFMRPDSYRALLKSMNARCTLWFKREGRLWRVSKGRLTANLNGQSVEQDLDGYGATRRRGRGQRVSPVPLVDDGSASARRSVRSLR